MAIEVKVVKDVDDGFEENLVPDWTDLTDVGLMKHMPARTDEHELISEPKSNEHDNLSEENPFTLCRSVICGTSGTHRIVRCRPIIPIYLLSLRRVSDEQLRLL